MVGNCNATKMNNVPISADQLIFTIDKDIEDSQTGNLPILGNSERGAHNIGENPYPSTKTVNPTRAVVIETSNSVIIEFGPAIPAV
jgi:hypothetical protein